MAGGLDPSGEPFPSARPTFAAHRLEALRPARIMVVEDDYLVALDVQDRLTEVGFVVLGIAKSAAEAIALATVERPELAIMDIRILGPRDGIETAIELRSRFDIPCVFATAHVDDETIARANPAGPLGWVAKPYSIAALVQLLNAVLPPSEGNG